LDGFREIENPEYLDYTEQAEKEGNLPIGCSQQTGVSCKTIIEGLVKIRATMIGNMTKSGQNANDPYLYTEVAIKRQNLVRSVSKFAAYYFFMCCSEHPEMDSVLKRYLSDSVKADSTETAFSEKSKNSRKKENVYLASLLEKIEVVGNKFGTHFQDQKERFYDMKKAEATKQYCDLKLLLIKEPLLSEDPIIKKRIEDLKKEINCPAYNQTPIRSPARKKSCTSNLNGSSSKSDDDSSLTSIPKVITKGSSMFDDDE
jgi:hypothetical protein